MGYCKDWSLMTYEVGRYLSDHPPFQVENVSVHNVCNEPSAGHDEWKNSSLRACIADCYSVPPHLFLAVPLAWTPLYRELALHFRHNANIAFIDKSTTLKLNYMQRIAV